MAEEINFKIFYMTFILSPTMQLGSVPWTEICAHNTTLARRSRDVDSGRLWMDAGWGKFPRRIKNSIRDAFLSSAFSRLFSNQFQLDCIINVADC